jgi:hypothetical protein
LDAVKGLIDKWYKLEETRSCKNQTGFAEVERGPAFHIRSEVADAEKEHAQGETNWLMT